MSVPENKIKTTHVCRYYPRNTLPLLAGVKFPDLPTKSKIPRIIDSPKKENVFIF
jgi:hypothetical protein